MEDSGSVRARNTAHLDQDPNKRDLLTTKPLHRFAQRDPKTLGVVVLTFGCAELLIGFIMAADELKTSAYFYTPFWQGILFSVSGILSICTGINPTKKMVTISLSMYVVSLLGIIVSIGFRIWGMTMMRYSRYRYSDSTIRPSFLSTFEVLLLLCSLCVSGMLIFLCVVARLALKSTRTQIILHQIPAPVTETPTEAT
ncbi:hypothetical protein WMY93_009690 [Mugilogobius chulae]|uniref:Uncharacterized protein n=1 Tax=Mugilogobius chulae TaxID=88201 RepID=A0AAW0PC71_9GOBI